MKKYLMIGFAAVAFAACSNHDFETYTPTEVVKAEYNAKFIAEFGQPGPQQDWGFGATTRAAAPAFTRAVPGITFPTFRDKTKIDEPGTIGKPDIKESDADIVYDKSETVTGIDPGKTVYVKDNVTLTINNQYSDVTLQRVKIYLGNNSSLVIANNRSFTLQGTCTLVNDGGTIQVSNEKDIILESFTGTFWSNGTISAKILRTYNGEGGNIYLGSGSQVNLEKIFLFKSVLFRNEGQITLTDVFEADQYSHKIYNSGTIITPKVILQQKTTLWNEGTIKAADNMATEISMSNDNVKIYNGETSTLKLTSLSLNNNSQLVVNEGTLNVNGAINLENNAELVSSLTLTGSSMNLKSGAMFYNVSGGQVDINGLTKLDNDGGTNKWQNSGKFNTNSFEITGGCGEPAAFNNCHMNVTNQFYMNHGYFVLDGGAAVECGSFRWDDDNYFDMGSKALLSITGQLIANNNDTGYGFYGRGSEYAVIEAGSIEKGSAGKFRAAYFGNLFIDTDSHFTQGETSADGTFYYFDETVKFSFTDNTDISGLTSSPARTAQKATNFSITIEKDNEGGCTPGYSYVPSNPVTYTGRIMAEDLTVQSKSDWDFNDVVFDFAIENKKAYILLQAAGGTLPLCIGGSVDDNGDPIVDSDNNVIGGQEVHGLFNVGTGVMVNTGVGATKGAVPFDLTDKTYSQASDILISVKKKVDGVEKWIAITAFKKEPAGKFVTDTDVDWVDEYANIQGAYPQFQTYVQTGSGRFAPTEKRDVYFDRKTRNEPAPAAVE